MASHIGRRKFLATLGGAAAAWPLAARAQQAGKPPTVGFLGTTTPSIMSQWTAAFVGRLRELGWIEGRTIKIEYRWAEGHGERYAEIAAEFVRLKVLWDAALQAALVGFPLDGHFSARGLNP
jgi:putative ABC transport system substrate-binding protein